MDVQSASQLGSFNVRSFGAAGDGATGDTRAFQAAFDACLENGGGTVFVPAGRFVCGTLVFHDHTTLVLDAGAVLLGSQNPADYPVSLNRWEGCEQLTYAPLIAGRHLQNIAILGRGTIDGRGETWWKGYRENTLAYPRPRLIGFSDCTNLRIEGITLTRSPSWTINPVRCENVTIHGVTILNPPDSPNTDGINPDSCRLVRISDCLISAGDDCIAIKSGIQDENEVHCAPCRDITITNCTLERGHGGVVIGSEMSGGVKNVVISNCVFIGTDRGIRLKSRRGRGGVVEDVRVTNVIMDGVLCPITLNLYYACGAWGDASVSDKNPRPVDGGTPHFRHIHLSHISARGARTAAGFIYGLAEMPVEDISLSDITIEMSDQAEPAYAEMADDIPEMSRAGFFIRNVRRLRIDRVEVSGQHGPAFDIANVCDLEINASGTPAPGAGSPTIRLKDVQGGVLHNCRATPGADHFLRVEGAQTRGLALHANSLGPGAVQIQEDVPPGEVG